MTHPSPTTQDLSPLDTEVLNRHGLRRQPFAPKATERFVYSDPALDMPVGVALQRLQTDAKPLLLVGEPGVGKSTQLVQLLSRGAAALTFCAFKGRPGATFASIEHAIRQQWGRTTGGQAASGSDKESAAPQAPEKNSLATILLSVANGERRPVLVIDDAHLLAPAVLGGLLRLRREVNRHSDNTMGIVLAGEPALSELAAKAHGPEMPAEPFTVIRLRPLMESQTDAYLRHRLQAAGAPDPGLLSGENAKAIHRESGGLPAKINEAANRCLETLVPELPEASADRLAGIPLAGSARGPYWVAPAAAGAFGVLIGALATTLFFLSSDTRVAVPEQTPQAQQTASFDAATEREQPPTPYGDGIPEALEQQPTVPLLIHIAGLPQPSTEPRLPPLQEVPEDSRSAPERDPLPDGAPIGEAATVSDAAEIAVVPPDRESAEVVATTPGGPSSGEPAVTPESPPTLEEDATSVPDASPTETAEAAPTEPQTPNALPEIEELSTDTPPVSAPAGPHGPDWVQERPSGQFTIQIIAGDDLEALHQFARRVSMETDVAWFRTRRGDQDWYALITGEYPDLASAQAAAARLPAPVRRNQPWVRSFNSVQQAMAPP